MGSVNSIGRFVGWSQLMLLFEAADTRGCASHILSGSLLFETLPRVFLLYLLVLKMMSIPVPEGCNDSRPAA